MAIEVVNGGTYPHSSIVEECRIFVDHQTILTYRGDNHESEESVVEHALNTLIGLGYRGAAVIQYNAWDEDADETVTVRDTFTLDTGEPQQSKRRYV